MLTELVAAFVAHLSARPCISSVSFYTMVPVGWQNTVKLSFADVYSLLLLGAYPDLVAIIIIIVDVKFKPQEIWEFCVDVTRGVIFALPFQDRRYGDKLSFFTWVASKHVGSCCLLDTIDIDIFLKAGRKKAST